MQLNSSTLFLQQTKNNCIDYALKHKEKSFGGTFCEQTHSTLILTPKQEPSCSHPTEFQGARWLWITLPKSNCFVLICLN